LIGCKKKKHYLLVKKVRFIRQANKSPVHLAYNPSYSACFLAGTIFFSHKKSANSVFQPAYNSSRTAPGFVKTFVTIGGAEHIFDSAETDNKAKVFFTWYQYYTCLDDVTDADNECAVERFNGVPFAIVPPDLQALHVVDVEKQRHGAGVRVRRQADHLVDLPARWVVRHLHI
jgi:hypothetical protein